MFGKDKVKGHNRLIKSKKGLKVTRVGDFLRKKDKNEKRNLAIGTGAVLAASGLGAALLLRKKGIKLPNKASKKNPLNEKVIVPKQLTPLPASGEKIAQQIDDELKILPDTSKSKKIQNTVVSDPWDSPIETIIEKSKRIVKDKEGVKLLSPMKRPSPRNNLLKNNTLTSEDRVISRLTKGYATLPLPMKVTLQMEKALRKPRKISNVGRPPESTGLKTILDDSDKTPIEKVISKAKRKVGDRLKRESEIVKKKNLMT